MSRPSEVVEQRTLVGNPLRVLIRPAGDGPVQLRLSMQSPSERGGQVD